MGNYYIVFVFMFFSTFGFSEATAQILNEGFEDTTFPPEDWTSENVSGTQIWGRNSDEGANSSANCAAVPYSYDLENWLITPQLSPSASNHELTFWIKVIEVYSYANDVIDIKVSTSDGTVSTFEAVPLLTFSSTGNSSDTVALTNVWAQYTIDLSAYIGQAIFIGFQSKGGFMSPRIDDVSGIPVTEYENDLKVKKLTLPSDIDFKYDGDPIEFMAIVENKGTLTQSDITVSFKVDGAEFTNKIITLNPGEVDTIEKTWTGIAGMHTISVDVPSDDNTINDLQVGNINVYPAGALVESFEGETFPPKNWTNEGQEWMEVTFNFYNGEKCASIYSNEYYLITPKLIISDGDSLTFYAQNGDDFLILSSSDAETWDTLAEYANSDYKTKKYSIYFNQDNNESSIGDRYIAFGLSSSAFYSSVYLDMLVGPKIHPVEDDFEMLEFNEIVSGGFRRAGLPIDFSVVVKNNTSVVQSKTISLKNGEMVLATGTTKELEQGEQDTITISWTPDQGYAYINIKAVLPNDDMAGNNYKSLEKLIYPQEPIDVYISEDFEGGESLPDYWNTTTDGFASWTVVSGEVWGPACTAHSGNAMLDFQCNSVSGNNNFISPWLNLSYNKFKISFWLYRDETSYALAAEDHINIRVNSNPDTTGSALIGAVNRSIDLEPVVDTTGWYYYEYIADCSDITSGFFILEGVADNSYQNIYIDELIIEGIPLSDASLTSFLSPADTTWGHLNAEKDVKLMVKNTGENILESATIKWSVNGVAQEDYAWTGSLAYNEAEEITIANHFGFAVDTTHAIMATISVPNDGRQSNDTINTDIKVKSSYLLPYKTGFEDADSLSDWLNKDVDSDSKSWEISTKMPKSGSQHIRSASFDEVTASGLTPDNWLITPGFYISHNKAYLSYNVGAADDTYFEEYYEVLISVGETDTADFVSVYSDTLTEKAYKQVTLDLEEYQGKTIFVAFRHYDCTDNLYINIDDVSLYYPTIYTVKISASPEEGGIISDAVEFIHGETITVSATSNLGYSFVNWTENNTEVSSDSEFTFAPTATNHELVANFDTTLYTITASSDENGTISPSGNVLTNYFESKEFTITANNNYEIADVLVDGESVGPVSTYTFKNVTSDHAITVNVQSITGTREAELTNIQIFPNPFGSEINIENTQGVKQITITNITGVVLYNENIIGQNSYSIKLNVPKGIYFMSLTLNNGKQIVKKLLKR